MQKKTVPTKFNTGGVETAKNWDDSNACALIAFCIVTGFDFDGVYELFQKYGRLKYHGTTLGTINGVCNLFNMIPVQSLMCGRINYLTLNQFIKQHPTGSFIIATRQHAMALIDGVIHDTIPAPPNRKRIYYAWRKP